MTTTEPERPATDPADHHGRLAAKSELITRWLVVVAITLGLLVGGALVWTVVSVRNTQLEGTPTGKQLLASAERILDCTDPGDPASGKPPGKCFSDSQARTAEAVGSISDNSLRVSAAIAYCQSRGVQGYKPLVKCAVRLVSARDAKP